jgi:hypothetical protein
LSSQVLKPEQFREFLRYSKGRSQGFSDTEKIRFFMDWCKKNQLEELIIRLSSETKGGWGENYTLDFTTKRIIISKKNFFRKFVDLGYVAGMAPYPYLVLSDNVKNSEIVKKSASIDIEAILSSSPNNYYLWYEDVDIRKGTETIVHNMMGSAIQANFLAITTGKKTYNFKLPTRKDGHFEKVSFWLESLIPVTVKKV